MRVLVVEDSPRLQRNVGTALRRSGYAVDVAGGGEGGLGLPGEADDHARPVARGGRALELPARDFLLLEYLARRSGEVVSRRDIEAHIYDGQVDPMSNVVDSAICNLRKKIAIDASAPPLIHTRRGMGY